MIKRIKQIVAVNLKESRQTIDKFRKIPFFPVALDSGELVIVFKINVIPSSVVDRKEFSVSPTVSAPGGPCI